jgi:hypothetical protein
MQESPSFVAFALIGLAGVLFVAGFGWISLKVLTISDAEWSTYHGPEGGVSVRRAASVRW